MQKSTIISKVDLMVQGKLRVSSFVIVIDHLLQLPPLRLAADFCTGIQFRLIAISEAV